MSEPNRHELLTAWQDHFIWTAGLLYNIKDVKISRREMPSNSLYMVVYKFEDYENYKKKLEQISYG